MTEISHEFMQTEDEKALDEYKQILRTLRQRELDEANKGGVMQRSSYTHSNAQTMKKYFDRAVKDTSDVCIPYDDFACRPARLYQLVSDALLWLCREGDNMQERQTWCAIKAQMRFERSNQADEGVWIRWRRKAHISRGMQHEASAHKMNELVDVVQLVMDWLENGTEPQLAMRDLLLTNDQCSQVKRMFESAGITDYRVEPSKIIAIRE